MNEEVLRAFMATAERLASAAESLDRVLARLDAQQESLNAKVDQIVASVDQSAGRDLESEATRQLQERVAELEKSNADLKAQAARMARKTLPPMVSAIVGKSGSDAGSEKIEKEVLEDAAEFKRRTANCRQGGIGAGRNDRVGAVGIAREARLGRAFLYLLSWIPLFEVPHDKVGAGN
jgi:predicted RNase H-like nuclease (RuvC/YqgF family)